METTKNKLTEIKKEKVVLAKNFANIFGTFKKIGGSTFVSIKGYTNSEGEISNQLIVIGAILDNYLKKDLNKLMQFYFEGGLDNLTKTAKDINIKGKNLQTIIAEETKKGKDILNIAFCELVDSLNKRLSTETNKDFLRAENDATINRSDAAKNAFEYLCNGLKTKEDEIYIYGLSISKVVLKEGEYKETKSQNKTLVKNYLQKILDIRQTENRMFKLSNIDYINVGGVTLE